MKTARQLRSVIGELLRAGAALANCAFNLAQRDALSPDIRRSLDEARRVWDYYSSRARHEVANSAGWVACSERMPSDSGFVLVVTTTFASGPCVRMAQFRADRGAWFEAETRIDRMVHGVDRVTHWMPLPEPPR